MEVKSQISRNLAKERFPTAENIAQNSPLWPINLAFYMEPTVIYPNLTNPAANDRSPKKENINKNKTMRTGRTVWLARGSVGVGR